MKRRLRLVEAVAIAALALLALKGIDYLRTPAPPQMPSASLVPGADQLPSFARVLAYARSNHLPAEVVMTGSTADRAEASGAAAPPLPRGFDQPISAHSPTEDVLLERLGERRDELRLRSQDLQMREKLLEEAETKLETRMNELKAMEARAQETKAAPAAETEQAGLKNIVVMYEAMKPKDAARVFDRLSLEILVPIVLQMNPRRMAEILAVMTPETAERLTVALARRASGAAAGGAMRAGGPSGRELPAIDIAPRN